jgi:hypothetical protein
MKAKRHYSSKAFRYENPQGDVDYYVYRELVDSGVEDKDIARSLNISEAYLKSLKKEIIEEY